MLIRIVKLTFKPENIPSFEQIFESSRPKILAFEGCNLVELYQDIDSPNIFFTYSFWDDPSDLENYRNSDFFKHVWSGTKKLFAEKPEAWSVTKVQPTNAS